MVKLNKIYTRTGDAGTTGLVDGSRLPKPAPRMQAVGDVDEANSAIGLAVLAIGAAPEAAWLTTIARNLITDHFKSSRSRLEIVSDDVPEGRSTTSSPISSRITFHSFRCSSSRIATIRASI